MQYDLDATDAGGMRTSIATQRSSVTPGRWIAGLAWATLTLSVPLLGVAAWFAYDAATDTSEFAALGILVTIAIAVPVVPAVVLAVVALRITDQHRAHTLAVIATLLVASISLFGAWLGLA